MRTHARATTLAFALIVQLAAAPAAADPAGDDPAEQARIHYQRGSELFERREYEAAIVELEAAYRLAPAPMLLFNLAQAHRLAGHCQPALELYRRHLAADPGSPRRPLVEDLIRELEACVARQPRTEGDRPGPAPGRAAPAAPVRTSPARAPARRSAARPGGRGLRIAGVAVAGGGAALGAIAALLAARAGHAERRLEQRYAGPATWDDDAGALEARGRRDALAARLLAGTGAAAVIAGATLWLLGRRATRTPAVELTPSPGAVTAKVMWSW